MTDQELRRWLDAYGRAWETSDRAAAQRLFGERASYREVPFDDPMIGGEAIERYWKENTDIQKDVKFTYEIIALTGLRAVVRWWAEYLRVTTNIRAKLDGVFLLTFDSNGLCTDLLEWWHRQERPA